VRFILAVVLGLHGVAHLVGFVSSWRLATLAELPYKTTILGGRVDAGDVGIRVIGVLWLAAAAGFIVAAVAVTTRADWAQLVAGFAIVGSLLLCAAGWPDSRIGLFVNVGLALLLVIGVRLTLFASTP
jgi:hypothetical protein